MFLLQENNLSDSYSGHVENKYSLMIQTIRLKFSDYFELKKIEKGELWDKNFDD